MTPRALPVLVLACVGIVAALAFPFLYVTPNRLLSGEPHSPHAVALALVWVVLAALGVPSVRGSRVVVALLAWALIAGLPLLASIDARALLFVAAPSARVPLGAGFWLMWLSASLLLLDRLREWHAVCRGVAWLALLREFHAQRGPFMDALLTHLTLAATTLVLALVIGAPLGWWAWRTRRTDGAAVGVLAFLQTV